MDAGIIGVFIPILAIGLGIPLGFYGVWTAHKQKLAKFELEKVKHMAGSGEVVSRQAAQIEELQDRVQVLERIVTDGGYDLATRIEALRDERPLPQTIAARAEHERLG